MMNWRVQNEQNVEETDQNDAGKINREVNSEEDHRSQYINTKRNSIHVWSVITSL